MRIFRGDPLMNEERFLIEMAQRRAEVWPRNLPQEPQYPFGVLPIGEYIRRWAHVAPDRPAVLFYGAELTYGALDRLSDRFAALLWSRGIRPGDRVAVFLQNCPQYHIAFYGLMKLGAVFVPVNPMFKAGELRHELSDARVRCIVTHDYLHELVETVRSETELEFTLVTHPGEMLPEKTIGSAPSLLTQPRVPCPGTTDLLPTLEAMEDAAPDVEIDLDAAAALNYTGGTTGLPKGCVHTQRHMLHTSGVTVPLTMMAGENDVHMCYLPMFWIAGEGFGLLFAPFSGGQVVVMSRWDVQTFMALVQHYRVTVLGGLVDNFLEMIEHPDRRHYDLSSLRHVKAISFSKKLNLDVRQRWERETGVPISEGGWGMTETHAFSMFTTGMREEDFDLKQRPVFVGLPMPECEVKVVRFGTDELLPPGEEGELCFRGPSVMTCYWNRSDDPSLRNGWMHTGDIAVLDPRGYVNMLGRKKDMLKVNGMSVFPAEIEALIGQHPSVQAVGVVGRPDATRGEVPVAFIWLRPDGDSATEELLQQWCRQNMATYKVPEIRFKSPLPMTDTGKVKKEELRELAANHPGSTN